MNQTKIKILEVFREFKTPVDGILNPQSLNSRIMKWDVKSQDESKNAIEELMKDEYIGMNDRFLTLTQKGFDFLNQDYDIEDTETIVLDMLRKRKLRVGNVIMPNWLTAEQQNLERIHFENFNQAINNVLQKEYIEEKPNGLFLTQKGYDKIYE